MPQEMNEGTEITSELENEIEVEVEQSEQPEIVAEVEETEDTELKDYSASVNKRISKLTAKMREAERREQAATEYAQAVQAQLQQSEQRTNRLDQYYTHEFSNRLTSQKELLSGKLKEAIDRGDSETQVDIQAKMASLATEEARMRSVQQNQKARAQQTQAQAQQAQAQQAQQQQYAQPQPQAPVPPPEPDAKAQAWTEKNQWFGENEAMTLTAFSIHKSLIEDEGFDPTSDEYYQEIDKKMREEFPNKFEKKQSSSPKVAGASRGSGSKGRKSVKLNPSQVAIANKLGVPLEKYAAQLERMNQS